MKRTTLCVALASLIAACGGGGGGGSSPAPVQAAQPKPVSIAMLGDSTMQGIQQLQGASGPVTVTVNTAPVELQIDLRSTYGSGVTAINYGVGGSTIENQINGSLPDTTSLANLLANDHSQIVVSNFGINDSNPAAETPEAFAADLTTLLTAVRNSGKVLVLEEPNPVWAPSGSALSAFIPKLNVLVTTIDSFAAANNIPLISQYQYIQTLPNWQAMEPGGDHPNDALYKIKADREASVLGPIVKSMQ